MQNLYENPNIKQFVITIKNPTFPLTRIKKEKHAIVIGATGKGKTTAVGNYVRLSKNEYDHVVIVNLGIEEPIYQAMEEALGDKGQITFFTIDTLPTLTELVSKRENPDDSWLIVFDDLIGKLTGNRKWQALIADYFLAGRKEHCTCWFLTQSFFAVPKTVRLQVTYVLMFQVDSIRELREVLKCYSIGVSLDELQNIYRMATCIPGNFLKIDVAAYDMADKFTRNFTDAFYPVTRYQGHKEIVMFEPGSWFRRPAPPKIPKGDDIHFY